MSQERNSLPSSATTSTSSRRLPVSGRSRWSSTSKVEKELIQGIYARTDSEINRRDDEIKRLEAEIELIKKNEIPYAQVTREAINSWPEITELSIGDGAGVTADSLHVDRRIIVVAKTNKAMTSVEKEKFTKWLGIRLNNDSIEFIEDASAAVRASKGTRKSHR